MSCYENCLWGERETYLREILEEADIVEGVSQALAQSQFLAPAVVRICFVRRKEVRGNLNFNGSTAGRFKYPAGGRRKRRSRARTPQLERSSVRTLQLLPS